MQPISPICEDTIRPHIGKQVCAVLHDGTHLYGTVAGCRDGKLFFSEGAQAPGTVSTSTTRAEAQIRTRLKNKAKLTFFGFGGAAAAAAISLVLIAALFAFPFGFGFPFFI